MVIRLFFIAHSLIILGCKNTSHSSQPENPPVKTQRHTDKYSIHIDSTCLPNPFPEESFGNYTTYYIHNDTTFLVAESCTDNKLYVYNLGNFSNAILDDDRLRCGRSHNICFLSTKTFWRLEENGNLTEYNNGNYTNYDNLTSNHQLKNLGLWQGALLDYSNEITFFNDSTIMFPLDVNPDYNNKAFSRHNFGYPITGLYNINTKKVSYEGITYPKLLFDKNYGLFTKIEQYCLGENILYAFVPLPEIWRYNQNKKTIERFIVKSEYDTAPTPALNFKRTPKTKDLVFQHFKTSPHYRRLVYDPYRNLFYRFYALSLPEKNEDGLYTTYQDRKYSVMILDKDFNVLAERILPEACFFLYFAVPTKDGLYINYGPFNNTNKDGIKILKISLLDNN